MFTGGKLLPALRFKRPEISNKAKADVKMTDEEKIVTEDASEV